MKKQLTYTALLEKVQKKEPVTFIRIGDGEVNAMLGTEKPANTDNHIYYPDLGNSLVNLMVNKPKYYVGIQNLAMTVRGPEIEAFKEKNKLHNLDWFNADILHHASIKGLIKPFFQALNGHENIILVGPGYLSDMKKYFKLNYHVQIPEVNCWKQYRSIAYGCSKIANRLVQKKQAITFLVCGSMMGKVLIDDLYDQYNEKTKLSLLDIGSLFDPFCGKKSRSYHKNMDIVEKNGY